ncbi:ADP-ribose pyrophosphatase YjhB, NUDIX family [Sanguibacter gelidistatuariae]|uniref:ADP-ribose pyrophosphatase YjhB, NUDIX family n=1 Tax=Sanguibacter gelidistatuariae TaxID=1814289 RepID=A0A1G6P147_9MICO|nr:NUDIX domain-containing protein [Sanguibacter gelidistatuariae]SDC73177.1 ADP-ribose pyrophosphatase YjhB, NUDIX family [Sanguibacter gelidistatuariae]
MNRFQVIPAAYVIFRRTHDGAEQVLLQLRQNTGYMDGHWACGAAGHVEQGESMFAAAVREAREELGVRVVGQDLLPATVMHRTTAGGGPIEERVDFFFQCRTWSGEPALQEADKALSLRWFDLTALPDPVVPHELYVLKQLGAGSLDPVVAFGF